MEIDEEGGLVIKPKKHTEVKQVSNREVPRVRDPEPEQKDRVKHDDGDRSRERDRERHHDERHDDRNSRASESSRHRDREYQESRRSEYHSSSSSTYRSSERSEHPTEQTSSRDARSRRSRSPPRHSSSRYSPTRSRRSPTRKRSRSPSGSGPSSMPYSEPYRVNRRPDAVTTSAPTNQWIAKSVDKPVDKPTEKPANPVIPEFLRNLMRAQVAAQVKKSEELAAKRGLPADVILLPEDDACDQVDDDQRDDSADEASRNATQVSAVDEEDEFVGPIRPAEVDDDDTPTSFGEERQESYFAAAIEPEEQPAVSQQLGPTVVHNPALHGCRNFNACYEVLNSIDEGTYGVVYRAIDKATGETVAVKKVKMLDTGNMFEGFPITSLREMNLLLSLRHPNVISVREIAVGSKLSTVYMIMDFEDHDIKALMNAMREPFQQAEVKCLMRQLLLGMQALHSNWIMHRDLKASNVLYNNQGILRICDFGMARQFGSPLAPYTEVVCTLWYRAPEMLLGTTLYGCEVDMWSVGCLMAEFLTKETLFPGQSEADQIDRIFQLCGTPNEERWPGIDQLRFWRQFRFKKYPNKLRVKFPRSSFGGGAYLSDQGFDLLSRLLEYDPKKRINVDDALNHPWFKELPLPRAIDQMPTFPSINKADRTQDRRLGIVRTPKLGGGLFDR